MKTKMLLLWPLNKQSLFLTKWLPQNKLDKQPWLLMPILHKVNNRYKFNNLKYMNHPNSNHLWLNNTLCHPHQLSFLSSLKQVIKFMIPSQYNNLLTKRRVFLKYNHKLYFNSNLLLLPQLNNILHSWLTCWFNKINNYKVNLLQTRLFQRPIILFENEADMRR